MFEKEIDKLKRNPVRDVADLKGLALKNVFSAFPVFFLIFIVLFILIFATAVSKFDPRYGLSDKGVHAEALVTSKEVIDRKDSCAKLYYEFVADNNLKYTGDSVVKNGLSVCEVKAGDKITVLYLEDNPVVNDIEPSVVSNMPPFAIFFIIPFMFLFFFAPMFLPSAKRLMQHQRLYKTGEWAEGRVVYVKQCAETFPGYSSAPKNVYIEFEPEHGRVVEVMHKINNDWLILHLKPGQEVNVVYNPKKPTNAMLVEAYLR